MFGIFTSTHWRGATRSLSINNERILYVERFEGERVTYTVTFDNGCTLDLDEETGKVLVLEIEKLDRPKPQAQYVRSGYSDKFRPPHGSRM